MATKHLQLSATTLSLASCTPAADDADMEDAREGGENFGGRSALILLSEHFLCKGILRQCAMSNGAEHGSKVYIIWRYLRP